MLRCLYNHSLYLSSTSSLITVFGLLSKFEAKKRQPLPFLNRTSQPLQSFFAKLTYTCRLPALDTLKVRERLSSRSNNSLCPLAFRPYTHPLNGTYPLMKNGLDVATWRKCSLIWNSVFIKSTNPGRPSLGSHSYYTFVGAWSKILCHHILPPHFSSQPSSLSNLIPWQKLQENVYRHGIISCRMQPCIITCYYTCFKRVEFAAAAKCAWPQIWKPTISHRRVSDLHHKCLHMD